MGTREADARRNTDTALAAAGWLVQGFAQLDLSAGKGIAAREFPLDRGHGNADYALYWEGKLAGVVEAKKEGTLLSGVEVQSEKYSTGVPAGIPAHIRAYSYEELLQRDMVSLDVFWLKDESLGGSANLPDPDVIAGEIADDLRAALEQFEAIQSDQSKRATRGGA